MMEVLPKKPSSKVGQPCSARAALRRLYRWFQHVADVA